jgi:putative ABC transport system ATP-binding protein
MNDSFINIQSLSKTYSSGHLKLDVLKNVTLTVNKSEIVALTGPSGSGKSTLLQLIGGLDQPTSGQITIDGKELSSMKERVSAKFRLENIGFIFQFFYLQPFLTLEQNIAVPGIFASKSMQELHERALYLARLVGIDDRLDHVPKELSGGQIQRAAIARALFNNPSVLLADEPTGNLDSKNGEVIVQLFDTIRRELGTTIIIVTHDAAIAAKADRTFSLLDGVVQ